MSQGKKLMQFQNTHMLFVGISHTIKKHENDNFFGLDFWDYQGLSFTMLQLQKGSLHSLNPESVNIQLKPNLHQPL